VYSVVLTMVPPGGKIQVIKAVRACTNLPLQQAKEIVDEALTGLHPVVKLHATEAQAVSAVQEIVEAGGRAEMAVE
jgi:ribosomal protein L7/L12